MKKITGILLALLGGLLFSGCAQEQKSNRAEWQVYYVSNSETKVEMHLQERESSDPEGQLDELIQYLSTNPEKLEYKAPLVMGFQLLDLERNDGRILLNVDAAYRNMPLTTEVLVRAAIVRTLTQLEGISYIGIAVEGEQLYDGLGNLVGWMSADQFIDNDGNEINTYEQVRVKLYFASEEGTNLIAGYRQKYYSTNTALERFVVEELIAGPTVDGFYPSVNPSTKIINVMTKDGICYVNLDESFLTVESNVPTDVSIYSIVNSLVELNNINKVQILINGETPPGYSNSNFERNLDIVTTLER
ncbi:MAG: GerMN domain-containing protein [Roseburia sp.]|nr:GerMN domain-containing protein [Roseburia sp.]MCM1098665.1 GerMN domain-containing protein [Ruminococcus flavefaciens]